MKLTRWRRWVFASGVACHLLAATAQAANIRLPDLGDPSRTTISPAQERKLGEEFMRRARATLSFLDDPEVDDYLQTLGERLVAHSDAPGERFRFFAIHHPDVNAFAVPGGFIGVHTGLVLAVQSEAELASVLAHEVTHVTQRHIPRLLAETQRDSLPAIAAILASILLASAGARGAEAGIALTTATLAQRGINYTRSFEEEADRVGMATLARAGFAPTAMPAFFERLQAMNRHNETNLPEFLRTHPVTTNRIADARARAEQLAHRPTPDGSGFHHMRARIRAQAPGNIIEIVQGFRANLAQGKYFDANAERYGYALALLRQGEHAAARSELTKLRTQAPDAVGYQLALAQVELAAGRYPQALSIYEEAHRQRPDHGPLLRQYAGALLKAAQPLAARDLLKPVLRSAPSDPALYKLMGTAAGDSGTRVEAHQSLAEYYYLMGNPRRAVEQLEIAARLAGDNFYLQSSIEARMKAIKDETAASETR